MISSGCCRPTRGIERVESCRPAQDLYAQEAQAATRAPPHPPNSPPWCQPWPRSPSRRKKPTCSGQDPKASRSGQLERPPCMGPNSCRPNCRTIPRRRAHPLRRSGHRALRWPARRQPRKGIRGPRAGRNAARSRPRQRRRVPQLSPPWRWGRRPRERQCRPEKYRLGPLEKAASTQAGEGAPKEGPESSYYAHYNSYQNSDAQAQENEQPSAKEKPQAPSGERPPARPGPEARREPSDEQKQQRRDLPKDQRRPHLAPPREEWPPPRPPRG